MSVETLNNSNEDLIQESLRELKDQTSKNKEISPEKAPEMTIDDLMKLTKQEVINLSEMLYSHPLSNKPAKYKIYKDNKWEYMVFKGKKLYFENYNKKGQKDWTYIANYSWSENMCFSFYVKKWNEYNWIYLDYSNNIFYKWKLRKNNENFVAISPTIGLDKLYNKKEFQLYQPIE